LDHLYKILKHSKPTIMITKETQYTKDSTANRIRVLREFDAPIEKVWLAWTDPKILDQWWAPKPWQTKTKSMNFREGGSWTYSMVGPDGETHWCREDFKKIEPQMSYAIDNYFIDERENRNQDFPVMHWKISFYSREETTQVEVEIDFDSDEDLNKIIEMGFKEGFAMAHGNLDELLQKI
jgi:uncharacterized protein YndB with AHSA1/START domain